MKYRTIFIAGSVVFVAFTLQRYLKTLENTSTQNSSYDISYLLSNLQSKLASLPRIDDFSSTLFKELTSKRGQYFLKFLVEESIKDSLDETAFLVQSKKRFLEIFKLPEEGTYIDLILWLKNIQCKKHLFLLLGKLID